MKKFVFIISFVFIVFSVQNIFAIQMSGTAPRLISSNPTVQTVLDFLNDQVSDAFNQALDEANRELAEFGDLEKLPNGFADANAYSSKVASMWGYQGYSLFAIMAGVTLAAHLPINPTTAGPESIFEIQKDVEEDKDIELGIAPAAAINFGLHIGRFIGPKRLYANVKFFDLEISKVLPVMESDGNFYARTTHFGIGVNYQLIKGFSPLLGLVKWRGISVGSGLYMQYTEVRFDVDIAEQTAPVNANTTVMGQQLNLGGNIVLDPSVELGLKMQTYTVPLEVMTSFRLLWIANVMVGAGIDINTGTTEIIAKAAGDVGFNPEVSGAGGDLVEDELSVVPGDLGLDASQNGKPQFIHSRIMAGLGLNLGPLVLVNLNATYYLDKGVAVDISAGFVW